MDPLKLETSGILAIDPPIREQTAANVIGNGSFQSSGLPQMHIHSATMTTLSYIPVD